MEPTIVKGSDIIGSSAKKDAELKVKKYDFKRPDKFSKDQIRTIAILHETFSRLTTTSLSSLLRMFCELHLACVDQMTYEEFMRSIPNPTIMGLVYMAPLKGAIVLEIDPPLVFAMIDRLFGGTGIALETGREITRLEKIILESIFTRLLGNLKESWHTVIDLNPTLGQIETNPRFAQIVPPTEMIVLASAEAKVGDVKGRINLCYPYLTIEPVIGKLTAQYWYSSARRGKLDWNEAADVGRLTADTELYFEGVDLSLRELGRLKKKSLIKLPDFKKGRAFMTAGGIPVLDLKREDKKPATGFPWRETGA